MNTLKQFLKLSKQYQAERVKLVAAIKKGEQGLASQKAQLAMIETALGVGGQAAPRAVEPAVATPVVTRKRRKQMPVLPRPANTMSMREALLRALLPGDLHRTALVPAMKKLGFVWASANPMNSLGSVIYGKNTPAQKTTDGKYTLINKAAAAAEIAAIEKAKKRVSVGIKATAKGKDAAEAKPASKT